MTLLTSWRQHRVIHNFRGPRIILGVLWALLLVSALYFDDFVLLVMLSTVASVAAMQMSRRWIVHGDAVNQLLVGAGTAVVAMSSYFGYRVFGVLLLVFVVALLVLGPDLKLDVARLNAESLRNNVECAGLGLRCSLFVLVAAVSAIQLGRIDAMALVFFLAMVSIFDAGDYLIGAGYDKEYAGPVAATVALLLGALVMGQIGPDPFGSSGARLLGLSYIVLCPAGQLVGSWLVPAPNDDVPALRRLDSWIIAAPVTLVIASLAQ